MPDMPSSGPSRGADSPRDAEARAHLRGQAEGCRRLGSPFTADLLEGLAERMTGEDPVSARILSWPGDMGDDAMALRLAGALHAAAREGMDAGLAEAWPRADARPDLASPDLATPGRGDPTAAALRAMAAHADWIGAWLDLPPQTNETGRAGSLIGGLLTLAARTGLPLELLEIGASAGLNQNLDRFRYEMGEVRGHAAPEVMTWGDPASPALIDNAWRGISAAGARALLAAPLKIEARAACDMSPLDVSDPVQVARLKAYVWPDQTARHARLNGALEIARAHPPQVDKADAAAWVAARLARPQAEGQARVLMHSIMWQYMPRATQAAISESMAAAGARADAARPLAWLAMEPDEDRGSAALSLTLWPGGGREVLARVDFHGRWTEWLEAAPG